MKRIVIRCHGIWQGLDAKTEVGSLIAPEG